LEFRFERVEKIGFGLSLIYWESGEVTLEENKDIGDKSESNHENIVKILKMIREKSELGKNHQFFDFIDKILKDSFWEMLRYILKPEEDDVYHLFQREIETYNKYRDLFKLEPFTVCAVFGLLSGRSPYVIHNYFKPKFTKKIKPKNLDDEDQKPSETPQNPFLSEHLKSKNESIDSIFVDIERNFGEMIKSSSKNKETMRNFYNRVEQVISNEINFEKQMNKFVYFHFKEKGFMKRLTTNTFIKWMTLVLA
jgi:hypothetical protein